MTVPDDPYRAQSPIAEPAGLAPRSPIGRAGSRRGALAAAVVAFLLGAATVGALAWRGDLARVLPVSSRASLLVDPAGAPARSPAEVTALETRLALLEDRLSRIDQQARAATGNAGRAEGLLIAQATRRAVERGQPLGYLADQLRVRFADAQPRAVETLIAFAQRPTTLSALDARLDTLAPQLSNLPRDPTSWSRVQAALSGLFTIRSDAGPVLRPEERIARIKLLLAEGQVDSATDAVSRLPGANAASEWVEDAHRFGAAQQALDTLESAAMGAPPAPRPAPAD